MTGPIESSGAATAAAAPGTVPTATPAVPAVPAITLLQLRRWQLGNAEAPPLPAAALPALLAPFRDPARVRHDYPLVLQRADAGLRARPLGDVLAELAAAATAQARPLHDNLVRLERRVRLLLQRPEAGPTTAGTVLQQAGEQMLAELQLRQPIADGLRQDLAAMAAALADAELLPLSPATPLRLLAALAAQRAAAARQAFRQRLLADLDGLRRLLQVEAQKEPAARSAAALQQSLGGASARFLDPAALARSVGEHRGSQRLDPARHRRLQDAAAALQAQLAAAPPPALVVVHDGSSAAPAGAADLVAADVAAAAIARFDELAAPLLATLRAVQLAELELQGRYQPDRHDPLLAALRWQDLGADELQLLPVVVAVLPAAALAAGDVQALLALLAAERPLQILALQSPAGDAGFAAAAAAHARLQPAYLGIAHRSAYVQQSTAARPAHLLAGLQRALAAARTALHVVDTGLAADGQERPLGAFLHANAAIEGRVQPLFQYDPDAGDTWARRFDFAGNPAPDADWPQGRLGGGDGEGDGQQPLVAFTFADWALLEPQLQAAFTPVPPGVADAELLPLDQWLQADAEAARHAIPFVWFATGEGPPQRAAVQRRLVHACRDRLRFWRTLQELAGVRNEHVREAVQRARAEANEQHRREREALEQQHQRELEQVREQAAGQAMAALARQLLELEPLALATPEAGAAPRAAAATSAAAAAEPVAAAPAAAPATPAAPAAAPPPAAEDEGDDPYIDSPRCSTCNDCVNLNPLLFVYNDNKQARIGDARKGTYAQLVQAAEKCPSRCIHPGQPLNADEPDLEALRARAAPFNS